MNKTKLAAKQRKLAAEQREAKAQYLKKKQRKADCDARQAENARKFQPGPVVKKGFNSKTQWPEGSEQRLNEQMKEAARKLSESEPVSNFEKGQKIW